MPLVGLWGVVIVAFTDHLPPCAKSCDATDSAIPLLKIPPLAGFGFDQSEKSPVSKSDDQRTLVDIGDRAAVLSSFAAG